LNNVGLGLYGEIVESRDYRDHKVRTAVRKAAEALGPHAESFDLRFVAGDSEVHEGAELVVVSNNRYAPAPRSRVGTRGTLDAGVLGVIAVTGPPPRGLQEWTTPEFQVDSSDTVLMGVDGEAVRMEPPLVFESVPLALRIRTS